MTQNHLQIVYFWDRIPYLKNIYEISLYLFFDTFFIYPL